MVIRVVLTEELIDCFHLCAVKGEYHQLFSDYRSFFRSLSDNLRRVIFPGHHLCKILSLELQFLFDFLKNWNQNDPNSQLGLFYWRNQIPEFFQHFKFAILEKNWGSFYEKYRPITDLMIREARKQEILDFSIEYGSESFDSFESMDEAQIHIPDGFFSEAMSDFEACIPEEPDFCIKCYRGTEFDLNLEQLSDGSNEETSTSSSQIVQAEISDLKQFFKQEIDNAKQDIKKSNQTQYAKLDTKMTSVTNKVTSIERRLEAKMDEMMELMELILRTNAQNSITEVKMLEVSENLDTKQYKTPETDESNKLSPTDEISLDNKEVQQVEAVIGAESSNCRSSIPVLNNNMFENIIDRLEKIDELEFDFLAPPMNFASTELSPIDSLEDENVVEAELPSSQNNGSVLTAGKISEQELENPQPATDPASESDHPIINLVSPEPISTDSLKYEKSEVTPIPPLSYDQEIQQMEDEFQKKLAEQKKANDLDLRRVQEQRREKNKKYQVGLRHRFGSLYTGEGPSQSLSEM